VSAGLEYGYSVCSDGPIGGGLPGRNAHAQSGLMHTPRKAHPRPERCSPLTALDYDAGDTFLIAADPVVLSAHPWSMNVDEATQFAASWVQYCGGLAESPQCGATICGWQGV